jgi:ABC-type Zn uptake system ZnuABC Zn-binding protein ZnuA
VSAFPYLMNIKSNSVMLFGVSIFMALVTAACGGITAEDTPKQLRVVATTALLADLVENVAGGSAVVSAVVPPGTEVHSFQTTPKDSIEIGKAGLIVSNGGEFDDFLYPVIEAALGDDAVHVILSQGLESATIRPDPHFWQNPVNTVHYVRRIQNALETVDPANAESYRGRADAYVQQLLDLDQEISQILEEVPPSRRHLVTYHDAFGHFGARYGWRTSALVSNDAGDVTPGVLTALTEEVRKEGIAAVFTEPQFRSDVLTLLAQDSGVEIGTIYSDVLDGNAATYVDMMRLNAENLAELLR